MSSGQPRDLSALESVFGVGVRPLHLEDAVFDAALEGWRNQQAARGLERSTIRGRAWLVRRVCDDLATWPWAWTPTTIEQWFEDAMVSGRARGTVRGYQNTLAGFLAFLINPSYPWTAICLEAFGRCPVPVFDDLNMVRHLHEYEGAADGNRPFTREELARFFEFCDERVSGRRALRRKGSLAAFRDATIFKVMYSFGLRRSEVVRLNLGDFGPNPHRSSFGRFGTLSVRYGKGANGSGPRRREVLTVFDWTPEVLEQFAYDVRPAYSFDSESLFLTERGGRVSKKYINARFASLRDELGLSAQLSAHCLRHSYITHLIEDGWDPLFVQQQAGHPHASTTAISTGVSTDFKHDAMRRALARQLQNVPL
jgi:integrase